jgi:hypothetical protein
MRAKSQVRIDYLGIDRVARETLAVYGAARMRKHGRESATQAPEDLRNAPEIG